MRSILFPCVLALALSGCVAAVIPVAAGGMIGRKSLHHGVAATPAPAPAATTQPSAFAALPAAPRNPDQMAPGQVYAGSLPAPGGAPPVTPDLSAHQAAPATKEATWSDLIHYVAAQPATVTDSVLLTRHGAGAEPRWVPCAGKPRAVIVDTAANPDGGGDSYVEALRTLGYAIVFTAPRAQADDPYFAARERPAHRLASGDAFVQLTPGAEGDARARIAARYCVLAIAGRSAADFPDGMVPGTSDAIPGWFALRR